MPISVTKFETKSGLLEAMETRMRSEFSVDHRSPFALLISGGNTPLPVYDAIAADPPVVSPNAHLAFADDRHVPIDSPESNYGNTLPMIEGLDLPEVRVLRIHPELSLEESARQYDHDLAAFIGRGGVFPLAFLGLGADGHTCSLFNDADLARCAGRLAAPVERDNPPHRVTVSPDLLAKVGHVIFVVAGNDKIEMIQALTDNPQSITAGKAVAGCASVELWRC